MEGDNILEQRGKEQRGEQADRASQESKEFISIISFLIINIHPNLKRRMERGSVCEGERDSRGQQRERTRERYAPDKRNIKKRIVFSSNREKYCVSPFLLPISLFLSLFLRPPSCSRILSPSITISRHPLSGRPLIP